MMLELVTRVAERRLARRGVRRTVRAVEVPGRQEEPAWALALSTFTNREPTSGKPLVLLHGLGSSNLTWSRILPDLSRHGPVWAPDWPGFGRSALPPGRQSFSLPELVSCGEALLEKVAPGGCVLVGQSLGGWIAGKLAIKRPDLVERLVLINPAGVLTGEIWEQRELFSPDTVSEIRHLWGRMWHKVPPAYPLLSRPYLAILRSPQVRHFMAAIVEEDFLNGDLHRMKPPVTVLWGLEDLLFGTKPLEILRDGLPARTSRIVELDECGHVPQMERPDVVIGEIGMAWKGEAFKAHPGGAQAAKAASGADG